MPTLSATKLPRDLSHASLSTLSPANPPAIAISPSETGDAAKATPSKPTKKANKNVKDLFFQKFAEHGFSATDIPRAIIIHEAMGIFMLALTWSLCYLFPISQHPVLRNPIERIMNSMPKGLSSSISSNGFINSRFGSSYIESSCLRKLIRPATLPTKVFLTFKLVELLHKFDALPAAVVVSNISDQPGSSSSPKVKALSADRLTTPSISLKKTAKLFWKKGFLQPSTTTASTHSLFDRFDAELAASTEETLECVREIDNSHVASSSLPLSTSQLNFF